MTGKPELTVIDGRRKRSERSRTAIITASLALIDQGILVPAAKQIADAAGVGIRSFFRHFEDMEALFEAVDAHARSSFAELFPEGDGSGPLDARIDAFISGRTEAFEQLCNIILSTQAQMWKSQTLRRHYARDQQKLRRITAGWFPETEGQTPQAADALEALTSFEFWHRLRHHQKLGLRETGDIMAALLRSHFAQIGAG